jgi:hypothetical protein
MFSLKADNKINVLHKKGVPCVCPYQTKIAVPVPHPIDRRQIEMQIQQFNCTSNCHFFFEEEAEGKTVVFTACTGCRFEIEEEKSKFQII